MPFSIQAYLSFLKHSCTHGRRDHSHSHGTDFITLQTKLEAMKRSFDDKIIPYAPIYYLSRFMFASFFSFCN